MKKDLEGAPTVVLTGSSSRVGRAIAEELSQDYRLARFGPKYPDVDEDANPKGFLRCDLTSESDTARAFEALRARRGNHIASFVHLEEHYDSSGLSSPLYEELNVEGTERVLRHLRAFEVEQLIYVSSLLVMKPVQPGELLTELSPLEALWDYPESKRTAERSVLTRRGGGSAVILRMASTYDDYCHSPPIARQIQQVYEKKLSRHFFPGNRSHGQSFLHIDDCVSCIRRAIRRREQLSPLEFFLVGEPEALSYGDLQKELSRLIHGKRSSTLRVPKTLAKAGFWIQENLLDDSASRAPWMVDLMDAHYPISIDHVREKLGFRPLYTLRQVLPSMVTRLVGDPKAWYQENGLPWDDGLLAESTAGGGGTRSAVSDER